MVRFLVLVWLVPQSPNRLTPCLHLPNLGGAGTSEISGPQGDIIPVSNSTLKSEDPTGAPVTSSGFLGAPTTLAPGVLEGSEPTPAPQPIVQLRRQRLQPRLQW